MIDWDLAVATANRFLKPGPRVTREEAAGIVADLRGYAADAVGHVRDVTGLDAPTTATPIRVVDRRGWVSANVAGLREVLQPVNERIAARRQDSRAGGLLTAAGSRVTGVEVGMLMSYLSAKVLGQYEVFGSGGSLLLVAPNIVHVERELDVVPPDFRLWVCLHEETHRAQFGAVPWLREHIAAEVGEFIHESEIDPAAMMRRLREGLESLVDSVRGAHDVALVDVLQTPRQREILARLTGVMSLLEGHADYVMDAVGPQIIPTVAQIRKRFQRRRRGTSRFDIAVRRLLGLEAKMRQYRDGERFVRTIVDAIGMDGFNRVWRSPNTLPSGTEISEPAAWLRRMRLTGPSG